ncbi:MAG: SH3 domain-containing protein [Oribacterium sp.]|nr:SH3 domain-containing protein [Oribacterium sp.]
MKKPNIKIKFEPGSDRDRLLLKISSIILIVLVLLLCGVLIARRTGSTNGTQKRWQASTMSELASASDLSDATESEIRNLTDALKAETVKNTISEYQNLGIVQCSSYINLRSAPDQKDISNIKGMLSNHAAVDIIEEHPEGADGWMKIRSGGMEGYISSSFVITGEEAKELVPELIESRACIVTDKLRIRSTPEIRDGNTVGSAAKGEKYQVLRRIGSDWLEIVPDNIDGVDVAYMSSKPENVSMSYGLDEARSLDLRQKVLNMYDHLGVSKASDYVNVRKTPEEDGINNIVGKLPGFAGANILGEENGWYKIQSGKVTGYVRADFIASGTEAEQLAVNHAQVMAIVNTDALNVRSEPSTDSQAWTQITRDQRYSVINQLDGWVQLDLDSGDDEDTEQGSYVSTRDNNVSVTYALQEAVEYYPALDAANKAAAFRSQIVNFACQYVGGRYVWGGNSLTNGVDCSGFTQQVLKHFGISVPRVSRDQARTGTAVSSQNMKPGDLIFYANRRGTINHVGMYIGNGQVVNAASRRSGIRIYRWNYRTPVAIRNVIGS